jgi:NTE family protein
MKKITLCFFGGSIKGYAHLWVYQALLDLGISVDAVSGASVWGLVAAFVAAGWTGKQVFDIMDPKQLKKLFTPMLSHQGLLSHKHFKTFLIKHLGDIQIEDLQKKCFIQTSNMYTGEGSIRSQWPLIEVLLAGISIPGMFKPVQLWYDYHLDGGITDNFPLTPFQKEHTIILGSSLASSLSNKKLTFKSIMQQSFLMMSRASITSQYKDCDIVFEPLAHQQANVLAIRRFSKIQADHFYQLGYESVMEKMSELTKLGLMD